MTKTYFPGLNALRFFAAMAVMVTHVEFTKKVMLHGDKFWLKIDTWIQGNALSSILRDGPPQPIHWISPFVTFGGYIGVIFFFVLSGFLITYLLLEEKRVSNTVAVKKFYMRRILRICLQQHTPPRVDERLHPLAAVLASGVRAVLVAAPHDALHVQVGGVSSIEKEYRIPVQYQQARCF